MTSLLLLQVSGLIIAAHIRFISLDLTVENLVASVALPDYNIFGQLRFWSLGEVTCLHHVIRAAVGAVPVV
jgi:hypothetical protein